MSFGYGTNSLVIRHLLHMIAGFALLTLVAGCSSEGPFAHSVSTGDIKGNALSVPAGAYTGEYFLFDIDENVAQLAGAFRPTTFANTFTLGGGASIPRVGVGDRLQIRIWEAGENGLFSTAQTKVVELDTLVDDDGLIFIPYVGRIRVSGQTVEAVRRQIQSELEGRAIEPQVQVVIGAAQSNAAVIVGDVTTPGRYAISPAGTNVLDLIAEAGGTRSPTYETTVRLKRGDRMASALLEDLFADPRNNVDITAGDNLLILHEPRTFTAFGAVKATTAHTFSAPRLTLAEALGKARGLIDNRSDPGGIFLFRFEDVGLVRQLRPDVAIEGFQTVPVVYRLSLREAQGFFFARHFEMRDKDVIYVANSATAEFSKFLRILQPVLGSASSGASISNNIGDTE